MPRDGRIQFGGEFSPGVRLSKRVAKVLAISSAVPGGYSVAVRRKLPSETRGKLAHWFETDGTTCGLKPVFAHPDLAPSLALSN